MQEKGSPKAGPILETARLLLRPMALEDAEAMHVFRSDPEATRLFGQSPHDDIERTCSWVRAGLEGQRTGTSMTWAVTLRGSGTVIGECCFWNIDANSMHAELGYELMRAHWGQGLMNEALQAVLDHGFEAMGLNRIEANPLSINHASQKVLVRLGFKQEGVLRQRHLQDGEWLDEVWFGMLRSDRVDGARQ